MIDPFRPLALIGLSGAGKSAVARALGERLGGRVRDLDAEIAARHGAPVTTLFAREGEAWFRVQERETLAAALADAAVIACGGGIVEDDGARALLAARCRVVWLQVAPAEALRRLAPELDSRPLLAGEAPEQRLEAMLARRGPAYAALAHVRVATDGRTPDAVATTVLAALASALA